MPIYERQKKKVCGVRRSDQWQATSTHKTHQDRVCLMLLIKGLLACKSGKREHDDSRETVNAPLASLIIFCSAYLSGLSTLSKTGVPHLTINLNLHTPWKIDHKYIRHI